jgi:hypothetical protein
MEQMGISVILNRIEVERADKSKTEGINPLEVKFRINLNSKIIKREENEGAMEFTMNVETNPAIAIFTLTGEAFVRGSAEVINNSLTSLQGKPPEIIQKIYQECIFTTYMLAKAMNVPSPSLPMPKEK